jgi:hypothetical protein
MSDSGVNDDDDDDDDDNNDENRPQIGTRRIWMKFYLYMLRFFLDCNKTYYNFEFSHGYLMLYEMGLWQLMVICWSKMGVNWMK